MGGPDGHAVTFPGTNLGRTLAVALVLTALVVLQSKAPQKVGLHVSTPASGRERATPAAQLTPRPVQASAPGRVASCSERIAHQLEPSLQAALPWAPTLTGEERARALDYYGSGKQLRRVAGKLLDGQAIKVVLLGGSVTLGWGTTAASFSYPQRFAQLLNATFPHRGHIFLNRAVSGSRSSLAAACLDQMVPPDTDLVVLEFTVNDDPWAGISGPGRRPFEQLLRKLRRRGPAVIILHHFMYLAGRPPEPGAGWTSRVFWWPAEMHYSMLAKYYDVPSVSMAAATARLMMAGVEGFKTDKYAACPGVWVNRSTDGVAEGQEAAAFYYADRYHPSDQGHKAMAEALVAPLLRAVGEVQAQRLLPPAVLQALLLPLAGDTDLAYMRDDARLSGLPPPMIPGNHETRTIMCAMQADTKQVVQAASGFQYHPERPNATGFAQQKWGWSGHNPGDWLELELDTRATGTARAASRPVVVAFGQLHSYEHMGTALAACTSGCACNATRIDATWQHRLSLSEFHEFEVTQHERCRIRLTILPDVGAVPSGEHKIVMTAVVVREQ